MVYLSNKKQRKEKDDYTRKKPADQNYRQALRWLNLYQDR